MKHMIMACVAGLALMACSPSTEPTPATPVEPTAAAPSTTEPAPPVATPTDPAASDTCNMAQYMSLVGKPATDPTGVKSGFALPDPSQIASDHKGQMIVYTKTAHGQMRVLWQDQKGSNRPERAMFEFLQTLSQGKPASSHINYFSPAEAKELGLETLTKDVRPDIYYKENAKRTAKAREHDIEGTVALSVIFGADGELSDLLVLKGLPYGLTARCLEALKKIRFRPAMKDGKPVSVRSSIEFNFQTYR